MAKRKEKSKDMTLIGLVHAYIEQITEIQVVIDKAKIDNKTIEKMKSTLKASTEILKLINDNKELIKAVTKSPIRGDAKKKFDALTSCITAIGEVADSLKKVGFSAISVLMMKPLIYKVIEMILKITDIIAAHKRKANPKVLFSAVDALVKLGEGMFTFLIATGFGVVPLAAVIAVLAVKAFIDVMFWVFDKKVIKKLNDVNRGIDKIAITLFLLSGTVVVMVLAGILVRQGWREMAMVMLYLLAVTAVFAVVGLIAKYLDDAKIDQQILWIAAALMLISLTAVIMIFVGEFIKQSWKELLIVSAYLLLVTELFLLIGVFADTISKGAKTMLWVVLSVSLIALTALMLMWIGSLIQSNWEQLIITEAYLAVVTGLIIIVGGLKSLIMSGVVGLILISTALIVFATSIVIMHAATGNMDVGEVGIISALIGVAVLISTLLGTIMPLPLLGAIALMAVGEALLFIAVPITILARSIETLKKIHATEEDMSRPIYLMDSVVSAVMDCFGGARGLIRLTRAVGRMMMLIPIATSLGIVSRVIASIAALNMPIAFDDKGNPTKFKRMRPDDFVNAATNAATIVSVLANLFGDEDFDVSAGGKTVTIHPITEDVLSKIARSTTNKMMRLAFITNCIGSMASTLSNLAALNIPDDEAGFDENGKPRGWRRMRAEDFTEAATNAATIASIMANLFADEDFEVNIGGKSTTIHAIKKEVFDNIGWRVKWKMNQLAQVVGVIGSMASTLQNIATLSIPDDEAGFDENGKPKGWRRMRPEDFAEASSNIVLIATTLLEGLTYYKHPVYGKSVMDVIDDMSQKALIKIGKAMSVLGNVSGIITAVQQMAQMTVPTKWNKDGQPIEYRILTPEEREAAIINTVDLVTFFLKALTEDDITDALDSMGSKAKKNLEVVMNSTASVGALVTAIRDATTLDKEIIATGIGNLKECILQYAGLISELFVEVWDWKLGSKKIFGLDIPWLFHEKAREAEIDMRSMNTAISRMETLGGTIEPLRALIDSIKAVSGEENTKGVDEGIKNLGSIVKAYCEIFTGDEKGNGGINISSTGERKFQRFKEIVQYHDHFANVNTKNLKDNTDQFVRITNSVNRLEVDKIIKYTDMWSKMNEFMNTMKEMPIEELADAIVNKIAPAMSDISDNVDKMSSGTQTASLVQPNPPTSQSSVMSDPTANNVTNMSEPIDYTSILQGIKEAVEDILQQRMMG